MSGIGLVLNVAKDALLTQQYAIDVISHNIANVNTEGYSRQTAILSAKDSTPYAGFLFGRGVNLENIISNTNDFIEKRLQSGTSDLTAMSEKEIYMSVMESIFNENSSRSLSNQFNDFWNAWQDLANNPSGDSERSLLAEYGELLAQSFKDLSNDLARLDQEINNSIEAGIGQINEICGKIANINKQILVIQTSGNANDLRDKRNLLVNQLSEYLDLNTWEDDDGNLQVATKKGYLLVNRGDTYSLDLNGREIEWQSSGSGNVIISDTINGGKLGGWLDVRDEIVTKYKADLDELAKATIWEVNRAHSQGVGLEGFGSVTGSYSAADSSAGLGTEASGLDFYDRITDGSFKIWLYDSTGAVAGVTTIAVSALTGSLDDIASTIDSVSIGGVDLNANIRDGKLYIETDAGAPGSFAFSDDTGGILAALGINTFFDNANAGDIRINDEIIDNKNYIAAAKISNNVGPAVGASGNASTGIITTSGPYTGSADAVYEIEIVDPAAGTFRWRKDSGAWSGPASMAGSPALGAEGVNVTFTGNAATDYTANDTFTISVEKASDSYGAFAEGDNTNALDVTNVQYYGTTIKRWSFTREGGGAFNDISNTTIDSYLHTFVGSIGIESQSVQREKEYKEVIQQQISATRDGISAVSLDEEMANLIKYQHAYTAAAKLITTSEEMLETILNAV